MSEPVFEISKSDLSKLAAIIDKKIAPLPARGAKALYSVAELWMTASKPRVPVKFGVLRGSGHVQHMTLSGKNIAARLVYGGSAASYAVSVHENLKARHKTGQAKYLESVVLERKAGFAAEIAARM